MVPSQGWYEELRSSATWMSYIMILVENRADLDEEGALRGFSHIVNFALRRSVG